MTTFHFNRRDVSFLHNVSVAAALPSVSVVTATGVVFNDVQDISWTVIDDCTLVTYIVDGVLKYIPVSELEMVIGEL